jgi:hypothetical protein
VALKTLAAPSAFGSRLLLLYWRQLAAPRITRRSSNFFQTTVKRPRDKGLLNPLVHWTGLSPHDFFRFLYELIVLDGMRLRKFFARCNLGVHIGPSGKTGAFWLRAGAAPASSRRPGRGRSRLVLPSIRSQLSRIADRTGAEGSSLSFARRAVAVPECLGSHPNRSAGQTASSDPRECSPQNRRV